MSIADPTLSLINQPPPRATAEDLPMEVSTVLQVARHEMELWRQVPLRQRVRILNRVADQLLDQADPLCRLITQEMNKPLTEALQTDIVTAVRCIKYLARNARRQLAPQTVTPLEARLLGRQFSVRRIPHGVVAVIAPWNYPIGTPASGIAAALLAGNTVILKPSELTPRTGEALVRIIQEVLVQYRLPPTICQVLTGGKETGQALIHSGQVDFAFFTGSEAAGRSVQQAMAAQGKSCTLELGGSDAMVVLPSARDYLETVARYAVWGRFANAGQTCAAVKRLLVHHSVYEPLLMLLEEKLAALRVGDPLQATTQMGPVASFGQKAVLDAQLVDAIADGATIWQAPLPDGLSSQLPYMAPTMVLGASPASRVWQEEVFGPMLAIWPYRSEEDLRAHTVESRFGLGLSIFGDPRAAQRLLDQLGPYTAGHIAINDLPTTHYAFPVLPWTGLKASGPGVRQGEVGLTEMTRLQVQGGQLIPEPAPWLFRARSASWKTLLAVARLMGQNRPSLSALRYLLTR